MPSENETYNQFPQMAGQVFNSQNQNAPVWPTSPEYPHQPNYPYMVYPQPLPINQMEFGKTPVNRGNTEFQPSFTHTVNGGMPQNQGTAQTINSFTAETAEGQFNYDYISSPARIAVYDSMKTAPRVIQIDGGPTHEYIEHIASLTFKYAKEAGGTIPYTVIREVSENFIHANFKEVIVSILDDGNTIRFADQGPGIAQKELAQEPGFSSAIEPMKRYIRGVGSGLPIVKDYLDTTNGCIQIEDNVNHGSVVTISLVKTPEGAGDFQIPSLTDNETVILLALLDNEVLGVTEANRITGIAVASVHTAFSKLEEMGLVEKIGKKRTLTANGKRVARTL